MSWRRFVRGALIGAAAAVLLPGCKDANPVGEGKGPTALKVVAGSETSGLQVVECGTTQLTAVATFDGDHGDSQADVTERVYWSSSNPGVIDVSNGDIETAPGSGSFFPAGTVIARTTGIATIRASYADALHASFGINAAAIGSLRIAPALTRLAPDSLTRFALYVQPQNDQLEQDLTSSAVWSLPSSTAAAELAGSASVQAHGEPFDTPFQLEARLYTCDRSVTQSMSLGRVSGLRLSYEQPEDQPVPLLLDDRLRVDAVFEDAAAPPQDLSAQVDVKNADGYDPDIAAAASIAATTESTGGTGARLGSNDYLLIAGQQADKPVRLLLTYDQSGLNLQALTREYRFSDIDVTSLRLDPETADLTYPALGQLSAYATFEDGIERPVTRYVSWSTEDTDLLSVVASGIDGGSLVPQNQSGRATVFADLTSAVRGDLEEKAIVNVHHQ